MRLIVYMPTHVHVYLSSGNPIDFVGENLEDYDKRSAR